MDSVKEEVMVMVMVFGPTCRATTLSRLILPHQVREGVSQSFAVQHSFVFFSFCSSWLLYLCTLPTILEL